jgi:hypothetical protein
MKKIEKTLIGAAGEHLVLSRLLAMGVLAAPAPRGARKVDILVNYIDGGNAKSVQVKTTMGSAKAGWWLKAGHESIIDSDLFYCFVDFGSLNGEIYVIPANVVASTIKDDHAKWLATPAKSGNAHNDTDGRRLRAETFTKPLGWMDEYLENWDLLV